MKSARRRFRPSVSCLEGRQLLSTAPVTRPPVTAWTADVPNIKVTQGVADHFQILSVQSDERVALDMKAEQSVFDPNQPLTTIWAVVKDHATGQTVDNEILKPTSTSAFTEITGQAFNLQKSHTYDLYLNEGTVGGSDVLIQGLRLVSAPTPRIAAPVLHVNAEVAMFQASGDVYDGTFDAAVGTRWVETMSWGDGSPNNVQVVTSNSPTGNGPSYYYVGAHVYPTQGGTFTATKTLTSVEDPSVTAFASFSVIVIPTNTIPTSPPVLHVDSVTNTPLSNQQAPGMTFDAPTGSQWNYTVVWGDGSPDSTGSSRVWNDTNNGLYLTTGHTYASPGTYSFVLTVTSVDNPTLSASAQGTVIVS